MTSKSKVILLDPTGEYTAIKGVQSVAIGESAFFRIEI